MFCVWCIIICMTKMADAGGFVRGETLDIFLGMLDKSELDYLFKEEMDNASWNRTPIA